MDPTDDRRSDRGGEPRRIEAPLVVELRPVLPESRGRLPRFGPRGAALAVAVFVAGIVATNLAGTPTEPLPSIEPGPMATPAPAKRFEAAGLSFVYPGNWRRYDTTFTQDYGSVLAIVGTVEIPLRCGRIRVNFGCAKRTRLGPGQVAVVVGTATSPRPSVFDRPPKDGWTTFVDGMPANLSVNGSVPAIRADEARNWLIAMPGTVTQVYTVYASLREPGLPGLREQVDALVASVGLTDHVPPLPRGPDARPAGEALVERTLDLLDRDAREHRDTRMYDCFPRSVRKTSLVVFADGPDGPLFEPLRVACSTRLEPTELRLWRLTLVMRWSETGDHAAGSYVERAWLRADGTLVYRQIAGEEAAFPGELATLGAVPPASPERRSELEEGMAAEIIAPDGSIKRVPARDQHPLRPLGSNGQAQALR